MLPQGQRPAASPRVITCARLNRKPAPVTNRAMRPSVFLGAVVLRAARSVVITSEGGPSSVRYALRLQRRLSAISVRRPKAASSAKRRRPTAYVTTMVMIRVSLIEAMLCASRSEISMFTSSFSGVEGTARLEVGRPGARCVSRNLDGAGEGMLDARRCRRSAALGRAGWTHRRRDRPAVIGPRSAVVGEKNVGRG